MACGGAVVATRGRCPPRGRGRRRGLVPPDDDEALASALREVGLDRDLNAALRAQRRRRGPLSWARTARATLEVYRGLGVPC